MVLPAASFRPAANLNERLIGVMAEPVVTVFCLRPGATSSPDS